MSVSELQAQLRKVLDQQRHVLDVRRASGVSSPQAEAALQALRNAERALRVEISRTQQQEGKKVQAPSSKVPCPECGRRMKPPSEQTKGKRGAHLRQDDPNVWCPAGRNPTQGERNRALHPLETVRAAQPEVRTVSGGLPTLGRRR